MMNMIRIVAATGALLMAVGVQASEVISGPTTSTTGNYTLSWDQGCTPGSNWYNLYENGASESLGCATSKSFSGKPDGNYYYELEMCELDVILGEFCIGRAYMGWDHTVTVDTGSGGGGQTGTGNVTVGDYNGDGLSDLYVSPSLGQPFLLSQVYDGHFQVLGNLTSQQINAYSNWTGTNLRLNELDYDVDGTDDVMVNGIGNLLSGVPDQVVFLSSGGSPVRLLAMDDARKQFLGEVLAWSFNKRYFADTALQNNWYTVEYQTLYGWWYIVDLPGYTWNNEPLADDPMDGNTTPGICGVTSCAFDVTYGWRFYGGVTVQYYDIDTSHFNQDAIDLVVNAVPASENTGSWSDVLDILEQEFGSIPCTGIDPGVVVAWDSTHSDGYFNDNHCIFVTLARYSTALIDYSNSTPSGPPPTGDSRLQVRIRAIASWYNPAISHASVHYVQQKQWRSAYPTEGDGGQLNGSGGQLVSISDPDNERHQEDAPKNTIPYAYVNASGTSSFQWGEILIADGNYKDNLPYCLNYPDIGQAFVGTCDGYNSNGYVSGLILEIGGTLELSDNSFETPPELPGFLKPVPSSAFE